MYEHVIGPSENLLQHVARKVPTAATRNESLNIGSKTQLVSPTVTIDCLPNAWLKYEELDHFN